jgi:hypothetical protein
MNSFGWETMAARALARAIGCPESRPLMNQLKAIVDWNDGAGQEAENVALGFELAAELEEQRLAQEIIAWDAKQEVSVG